MRQLDTMRQMYQRTWLGTHVNLTRGLLLAESIAVVGLLIAVPYLIQENASADRHRDCLRRAESGAELATIADEAVDHAEDTVVLSHGIADRLNQVAEVLEAASASATSAAIVREFRSFGEVDVPRYAKGVERFREAVDEYEPTTLSECGVRDPRRSGP